MWKLKLPKINHCESHVEKSLGSRESNRDSISMSPREMQSVLEVYKQYDKNSGLPSEALRKTEISPVINGFLRKSYQLSYRGKCLYHLRKELLKSALHCPFCGFGDVQELDHYLPKEKYETFSIYPRNLIPCCSVCNKKKSDIDSICAEKQFAHVYFEEIPSGVFFKASVSAIENKISIIYYIDSISGMSVDTKSRLDFQLSRLELNKRYAREINHFFTSIGNIVQSTHPNGLVGMDLRRFLLSVIEKYEKTHGRNHFLTVLLRALYDCGEFCSKGFSHYVKIIGVGI